MFVDSHCHLDFPELAENLDEVLQRMRQAQVNHALVVSVNKPDWPRVLQLAQSQPHLWASVGVHPAYPDTPEASVDELVQAAASERVVAIGETGLDYYRSSGDMAWQHERFRNHIRAARETGLPLIIHTREAREDTIRILREEGADEVGGVMHCFTETQEMAEAAMDMGFYISLSGIVTFKNAQDLQKLAAWLPLDRLLIETDAPFLAPVPYRGKTNDPSLVVHVAEKIANLRQQTLSEIAKASTDNFFRLFSKAKPVTA